MIMFITRYEYVIICV